MSEVISISTIARQHAQARAARATALLSIAGEMKANAEALAAAARTQLDEAQAELRALDAISESAS